jgi:cytochrome P450
MSTEIHSRLRFGAVFQPTWNLRYNLIPFLVRVQRDHGDVVRMPWGRHGYVLVSDPELVDEILVTDAASFPRGRGLKTWSRQRKTSGYNPLGPYSERDRFLPTRRALQAAFAPARSSSLWEWFGTGAVERLLGGVDALTDVDLVQTLRPGALELTFAAALGTLDEPSTELAQWYRDGHFYMLKKPSRKFYVLDYLRVPSKLRAASAIESMAAHVARGIDEGDPAQTALLDTLHGLVRDGTISHEEAMWQAVSVLMTANHGNLGALSWTLWRLAANPRTLDTLRAELEARPDARSLDDLPYLEAVVDESFRQHPTIVALTREARAERTWHGVTVRPGDVVDICPTILHNDPRWWSEPETFAPERWLDGRDAGRPKQSFLPFGAGMRKCLAYPMVKTMVGSAVASLVQTYDFHVRSGPRSALDSIPRGIRVDVARR